MLAGMCRQRVMLIGVTSLVLELPVASAAPIRLIPGTRYNVSSFPESFLGPRGFPTSRAYEYEQAERAAMIRKP